MAAIGVPSERIVRLARAGQLLAVRPDRPVRAVQRALPRPRPGVGRRDDLPGGETERFLEYWNLVFMQYDQDPVELAHAAAGEEHRHRPRPQPHGAHPAGRADDLRDRPVRAADDARPRAREPHATTSARCGSSPTTRGRRRSSSPTASCRPTRTAATSCAGSCAARCSRATASASSRASCRSSSTSSSRRWATRTPSCGRAGRRSRSGCAARRRASAGRSSRARGCSTTCSRAAEVTGEDAFRLHDTYGFPIELTREIADERGIPFAGDEFARLMGEQRARSSAGAKVRAGGGGDVVREVGSEADRVHRLRAPRAAHDRHRPARARRPDLRQARRVALLRGGRRPDLRRRRDRVRGRRLPRRRRRRRARGRRPGRRGRADRGRAARRRARRRARGPGVPPRDRVQPHRDAPSPRGAAQPARRARAPGRLVRRPGQAALRLHAHRALSARGAPRGRGQVNALDPRQPPGARRSRRRSTRPSASARWRCSARSTATSCGWSRSATAPTRASCAAARTCARPPRSGCSEITPEGSSAANVRRIEAVTGPVAVGLLREHDACCAASRRAAQRRPSGVPQAVADAAPGGQGAGEAGERQRPRRRRRAGDARRGDRRRAASSPRSSTAADAKALMDRRPGQGQARRGGRDRARHGGDGRVHLVAPSRRRSWRAA